MTAETGGETPILSSTELYTRLAQELPDFIRAIEEHGVKYVRTIPEYDDATSAIGRGWRSTYLTETPEGAEDKLRSLGGSWEWLDNGDLKTITGVLPAIKTDVGELRSLDKVFFNSIVAAYKGWNDSRNRGDRAILLGNDTYLAPEAIEHVNNVMQEIAVRFTWQRGDVLLLDNRVVMHSRNSFTGARTVLAALARHGTR